MEGAVRSGYLAAQALTRAVGQPQTFLVPDLPSTGLMRLFRSYVIGNLRNFIPNRAEGK
jgi:hypothetical protein